MVTVTFTLARFGVSCPDGDVFSVWLLVEFKTGCSGYWSTKILGLILCVCNMWCFSPFNTEYTPSIIMYFRLLSSCRHSGWQIETNTVKLRCPTGIAGRSLSLMKTKLTSAITSVFWCVNGALKRQVRIHFRAGSCCPLVFFFFLFFFIFLFHFNIFFFLLHRAPLPSIQSGPRAGLLPVANAWVHSVVPGLAFCIPLSLLLTTPSITVL